MLLAVPKLWAVFRGFLARADGLANIYMYHYRGINPPLTRHYGPQEADDGEKKEWMEEN